MKITIKSFKEMKQIKKESSGEFHPLDDYDRMGFDAPADAEILNARNGDYIYSPEEGTEADLISSDMNNTCSFSINGDHREDAKKLAGMSYEDAVKFCQDNGWDKLYG